MTNKFLEKIAGLPDLARYVGDKLKFATGIKTREYIGKTLNTNDPDKLMNIGGSFNAFSTKRKLLKAKMGNNSLRGEKYRAELKGAKNIVKEDIKDLHQRTLDARIVLGAGTAGVMKLKSEYENKVNAPQTYYNGY